MSRGAVVGVLALLLAAALPVQGQQWKGERLCATGLPRGGEFGSAVAVGTKGTIAVGDYRNDVVYLFRRNNQGVCEQLNPPVRGRAGEWFGFDVAIDEDKSQLLVGAPKSGGTGAAFLVTLSNGSVVGEPQRLLVPNPRPGDEIGSSVAIDGGILAIGARGAADRSGQVYAGDKDHLTMVSTPPALAEKAELGQSVALSGQTLVMGAPSPFRGSGSPGAAYVVAVASNGPLGVPKTLSTPGGLESEAAFGYAVAVAGPRILVGAPLANRNGVDSGAIFSFQLDGNGGVELGFPSQQGDQLGVAVALDGEDNEIAVAGARYAKGTRGAAYLKKGNGPSQTLELEPAVPIDAQLGVALAIRNGIVVVGAFRENGTGAAYLFQPVRAVEIVVATEVQEIETTLLVKLRSGDANPVPANASFRLQTLSGTAEERPTQNATGDYDYLRLDREVTLGTEVKIQLYPDDVCEQPETFQVVLSDTAGKRIQAVQVTILDDDSTGGLEISPAQLNTSEGTSVPLSFRLTCQPSGKVTVSLEAIPPLAGFSSAKLGFTDKDWDQLQTVSVSGTDNAVCGPEVVPYEIRATVTNTEDPRFAGLSRSIPAENADDELACLSAEKTVCIDGGGTVVYTISLINSVSGVPDTPALFRDDLPAGVSVVTASADRGTATADPIANSVRWTVPVPAGGEAATITIVAALDDPPGPALGNQADVSYDRDGRDHREIVQIVFSAEDVVPCPP